DRQGKLPEPFDELRTVDDADEALAGCRHDLLARERTATALDHAQAGVDLVGAIDIDWHPALRSDDRVQVQHLNATGTEKLAALLRTGDSTGHPVEALAERLDEKGNRRTASNADDRAVHEFVESGPGCRALEFVLC